MGDPNIFSTLSRIFEPIFDAFVKKPMNRFYKQVYLMLRLFQAFIVLAVVVTISFSSLVAFKEGAQVFLNSGFWGMIVGLIIGFVFFELVIRINFPKEDKKSQAQAKKLHLLIMGIFIAPIILAASIFGILLLYFFYQVLVHLIK